MDKETNEKHGNPSPKLTANFISKLSFWWLLDLFWYGKTHDLKANDLYDVLPENISKLLGDELEISWEKELNDSCEKKEKPSLWRAIIRICGWSFLKYMLSTFILNIIKIIQPVMLAMLLSFFNPSSNTSTAQAYAYASGLLFALFLQSIIVRQAHLGQQEIGMRVRIACSSLIHRKVLKLSSESASQLAGGLVINLLSNDVAKFELFALNLQYAWIMPIIVTLIAYLVWQQLGVASLVGIMFMILQTIPTQVFTYNMTSKLRLKGAARTDKRVLLIEEIIKGIRVIKMYTWEKSFEQLVYVTRKYEIDIILKRFYVRGVRLAFNTFSHRIALFFTILVYVLQDNVISADKIFPTAKYFMLVRSIMTLFFSEAVSLGAEVNVSIKRIEDFLLFDEISQKNTVLKSNNDNVIFIEGVDASWDKKSTNNNLCDINICVPQRKLYIIFGPVGSGKSSLLKLILGELQPKSGQVSIIGNLSYSSQDPWLFNGSVRDNILFGESYDKKRYNHVIKACALLKDFQRMPYGDKTLVGERGAALSGGQCARLNLARAVYRKADIYLFDDPLSAVDIPVGDILFQDCINELLKNKTRILVTHQARYLKESNAIILLNNGHVEFQGTFQSFCKQGKYFPNLPSSKEEQKLVQEENNLKNKCSSVSYAKVNHDDEEKGPIQAEEFVAKGRINNSLYLKYFEAGASYLTLLILLFCFIITQLLISGFDYWLTYWINKEERHLKYFDDVENNTATNIMGTRQFVNGDIDLSVYGILILGIIIFSNLRNLLFYKTVLDSSRNIHNSMFARLIRAPIQFFELNPSGRIVNRFSKDIGVADDFLPSVMLDVIERFFLLVGIITQILIINWWSVFSLLISGCLFLKINDIYISTARDIKRLEGIAKSPIFSLVNSSLTGLSTIRSCQAQNMVQKEFDTCQDQHTAAHYLVVVASSAFSFWIDMVSTSFLCFVTYSFIFLKNSNTLAGDVGLALMQSLTICGMLQFAMKQVAEAIAQMTSVERIYQLAEIDQEGPFETRPDQIPDPWLIRGEIEFKSLYLRYADEKKAVLNNLNFTIKPQTKVAIVGRTGAGKSSLVSTLFRLSKFEGSVLIDSINTKEIGLLDLRSRISVIPQEPILFSASLRDNLDPFHLYNDALLWSTLEEVKLNKLFDTLDHSIDQGGRNFSIGQRQLLCLARAILKRNKILILDEATANIDPTTDDLIQKTIRNKFKDCTVLMITHRLNSIMDSDQILVLEDGEVVEFDQVEALLQRRGGHFLDVVQQIDNATLQQH